VKEVPLPCRTFPAPTRSAFDVLSWIEQAIYAGLDPWVWIPRSGKRWLRTREITANPYLQPAPPTGRELSLVMTELIRLGRWFRWDRPPVIDEGRA